MLKDMIKSFDHLTRRASPIMNSSALPSHFSTLNYSKIFILMKSLRSGIAKEHELITIHMMIMTHQIIMALLLSFFLYENQRFITTPESID
jgi:hypothetical protein